MSQLIYSPHRTAVVVGHSHFFRAIFQHFTSPVFKERDVDLANDLSTKKLCNCGVAKIVLDASVSRETPIMDVELLLDTELTVTKRCKGTVSCTKLCGGGAAALPDDELLAADHEEIALPRRSTIMSMKSRISDAAEQYKARTPVQSPNQSPRPPLEKEQTVPSDPKSLKEAGCSNVDDPPGSTSMERRDSRNTLD